MQRVIEKIKRIFRKPLPPDSVELCEFSIVTMDQENEFVRMVMDVPGAYLDGMAKYNGHPGAYLVELAAPMGNKYRIVLRFQPIKGDKCRN